MENNLINNTIAEASVAETSPSPAPAPAPQAAPAAAPSAPTPKAPSIPQASSPKKVEDLDLTKSKGVKLKTKGKRKTLTEILNEPHLKFQDKMLLTDHLATMIEAGITIAEAMTIMVDQSANKSTKKMYQAILDRINSGQTLSISLGYFPKIFSPMFINMVAIGEKSGSLEQTLRNLQQQQEKAYDLKKKITGAMIYPGLIITMTLVMALGIVIFVMPKITDIFGQLDLELPLPTRALIAFSNFLLANPLAVAFTLIFGPIIFLQLIKNKHTQPYFQAVTLRIPVFGRLIIAANLARFFQSVHSLLKAGVDITKGLQITASLFGNVKYKNAIMKAHAKVEKGSTLDASLTGNPLIFPIMCVKMINVGERTGNIEATSAHLAHMYEKVVDDITKNLSVLIEPMLLGFMGALVSGIALAIILPIYKLPSSF